MRDVVKNQSELNTKHPPQKRKRRRKNLSLYYAMVFILVVIVGIVLSLTVLFNISEINVEGESIYSADEIIKGSGIAQGTNLIRLDTSKAEKNILGTMVYIDTVTVNRVFPDKVLVSVTPSVVFANVKCDNGYLLISESGKILNFSTTAEKNIPTVIGFDTTVTEVGGFIKCEDDAKDKLFRNLASEMLKNNTVEGITEIDITDRYNINLVYDGRITIELGSQSDLEYKLQYAYMLVTEKISIKKTGVLYMRGSNSKEASFVESSDLNKKDNPQDTAETTAPEDTPDNSTSGTDSAVETTAETTSETAPETTAVTEETTTGPPVGLVPST